MAPITPRGSVTAPVYVIIEEPYAQDVSKGYCFSDSYGYVFDKMMRDAGLPDYYVLSRRSDPDHPDTYSVIQNTINQFRPPIIIPLGDSLGFFCPETKKKIAKRPGKTQQEEEADLGKYAGSLLTCSNGLLSYPHYILSTFPPDIICRDWSIRDICTNLDLGKAKDELDFYRTHGYLQLLPEYKFEYNFEEPGQFPRLLQWLERFKNAKLLSVDIETIYPNRKSAYWPHPGYPVTIGISDNSTEGISFRLFRDDKQETLILWRRLADVLSSVPLLGQNFFDFDAMRFDNLGFCIDYEKITDTLIRHHILWAELPHKLQFQTRQYTRQPYYKDEGHGWNLKDMNKLKRYNCLDVCITYEIYEKQEEEFRDRPHLR